jgi:hypothetical protein
MGDDTLWAGLDSVPWVKVTDAFEKPATAVPLLMMELTDADHRAREEAAGELRDALLGYERPAPVAPEAAVWLLKLLDAEGVPGRAHAALLLAELALFSRDALTPHAGETLRRIQGARARLEAVAAQHDGSTALGTAVRVALLASAAITHPVKQLLASVAAAEALVLEAEAKEELPAPTAAQLAQWRDDAKGRGAHEVVFLARRALEAEPSAALAILEAARPVGPAAGITEQLDVALLWAEVHWALGRPAQAQAALEALSKVPPAQRDTRFIGSATALLPVRPGFALELLKRVETPQLEVRRRALRVEAGCALKHYDEALREAVALARAWLVAPYPGAVNQILSRGEVLALLERAPRDAQADAVYAEVKAAPEAPVVMPEGDTL